MKKAMKIYKNLINLLNKKYLLQVNASTAKYLGCIKFVDKMR